MSSLSVHLRHPDDHSGLPFHASCPICRQERLAGSLEGDEIVSRRTQAAIAAGLLAFSGAGGQATAVATEPDLEIDGSAEVVESPDTDDAALDESTIGWADGGAAPTDDEEPAAAPEAEDGMIEAAASEPVEEEPVIEAADDEPVAETEPAPEPVAVAAPPADVPTPTTIAPEPASSNGVRAERATRERPVKRRESAVQPRVVVAAPAPPVAPATTNAVTVRVAAGSNQNTVVRVSRGDRIHTVQRGESLWSIATDVLGGGASTDRVAREVQRLWELNAERIGTGSPDLLYAGTRLRLR
jgi:hypothetical protein